MMISASSCHVFLHISDFRQRLQKKSCMLEAIMSKASISCHPC